VKGKKNDPTSMLAADPIIGMNFSSSQTELVQSWGLGYSGHTDGTIQQSYGIYMFLTFNPSACKYLPTPNSQL
jgi:hypothetical protein